MALATPDDEGHHRPDPARREEGPQAGHDGDRPQRTAQHRGSSTPAAPGGRGARREGHPPRRHQGSGRTTRGRPLSRRRAKAKRKVVNPTRARRTDMGNRARRTSVSARVELGQVSRRRSITRPGPAPGPPLAPAVPGRGRTPAVPDRAPGRRARSRRRRDGHPQSGARHGSGGEHHHQTQSTLEAPTEPPSSSMATAGMAKTKLESDASRPSRALSVARSGSIRSMPVPGSSTWTRGIP